jgi:succinate dehydrogenase/fumarate reductase flavoprotein subunit
MFFDETYRKKRPIIDDTVDHGWILSQKIYQWSEDNSAEIESGWIKKADTIKDLAEIIKVPPEALEDTVKKYNEGCSLNNDVFGRGEDWLEPIETPPFYTTELCAIVTNTQGGPKHNSRAQILDNNDKPIPRIYAAGELGSVFGPLYGSGGNNLPEAFAFGRIAGEHAAALKPWD